MSAIGPPVLHKISVNSNGTLESEVFLIHYPEFGTRIFIFGTPSTLISLLEDSAHLAAGQLKNNAIKNIGIIIAINNLRIQDGFKR